MSIAQIAWLATLCVASITININLLKIITDDKFDRPNLVSLIANGLLSIVGGFFAIILVGLIYAIGFVVFNGLSFLIMYYFTKKRTVRGLELGERLLIQFKTIDLQICYILAEIYNNNHDDLLKPIRLALRYVLSELPDILGLDNKTHHPQLSVLIPKNNKFKVIAYSGIENFRVEKMEELFEHGSKTVSIAGRAMNQRKAVIINDLSDGSNPELEFYIKTFRDEDTVGSMLAFPIMRGLEPSDSEPIAILCITSKRTEAFKNQGAVLKILSFFAIKIEILQNCLDLTAIPRAKLGV